eukprot:137625_1
MDLNYPTLQEAIAAHHDPEEHEKFVLFSVAGELFTVHWNRGRYVEKIHVSSDGSRLWWKGGNLKLDGLARIILGVPGDMYDMTDPAVVPDLCFCVAGSSVSILLEAYNFQQWLRWVRGLIDLTTQSMEKRRVHRVDTLMNTRASWAQRKKIRASLTRHMFEIQTQANESKTPEFSPSPQHSPFIHTFPDNDSKSSIDSRFDRDHPTRRQSDIPMSSVHKVPAEITRRERSESLPSSFWQYLPNFSPFSLLWNAGPSIPSQKPKPALQRVSSSSAPERRLRRESEEGKINVEMQNAEEIKEKVKLRSPSKMKHTSSWPALSDKSGQKKAQNIGIRSALA